MGAINLTEIRARAQAATGGAWVYNDAEVVSVYTDDMATTICEADTEENLRFIAYARADIPRLCNEIETLRAAAHGDQVVIQRLRREADYKDGVIAGLYHLRDSVPQLRDERDELKAENHRLAALTGSVATEAEAMKRERDELRDRLAQANQRAASRGGRVPR